jgi:hypothetical protein
MALKTLFTFQRLTAVDMSTHSSRAEQYLPGAKFWIKLRVPQRQDVGALRLRLVATKDRPCAEFPLNLADGKPDPAVLLDLDYWAILLR